MVALPGMASGSGSAETSWRASVRETFLWYLASRRTILFPPSLTLPLSLSFFLGGGEAVLASMNCFDTNSCCLSLVIFCIKSSRQQTETLQGCSVSHYSMFLVLKSTNVTSSFYLKLNGGLGGSFQKHFETGSLLYFISVGIFL